MKIFHQPGFAKTAIVGLVLALTYLTINNMFIFTDDQSSDDVSISQIIE